MEKTLTLLGSLEVIKKNLISLNKESPTTSHECLKNSKENPSRPRVEHEGEEKDTSLTYLIEMGAKRLGKSEARIMTLLEREEKSAYIVKLVLNRD